jgi:hypothetical protein
MGLTAHITRKPGIQAIHFCAGDFVWAFSTSLHNIMDDGNLFFKTILVAAPRHVGREIAGCAFIYRQKMYKVKPGLNFLQFFSSPLLFIFRLLILPAAMG